MLKMQIYHYIWQKARKKCTNQSSIFELMMGSAKIENPKANFLVTCTE